MLVIFNIIMVHSYLKKGQVLSLESTTYPGTTKEELYPFIEKNGFNFGFFSG